MRGSFKECDTSSLDYRFPLSFMLRDREHRYLIWIHLTLVELEVVDTLFFWCLSCLAVNHTYSPPLPPLNTLFQPLEHILRATPTGLAYSGNAVPVDSLWALL
jgi:hypothetical protein